MIEPDCNALEWWNIVVQQGLPGHHEGLLSLKESAAAVDQVLDAQQAHAHTMTSPQPKPPLHHICL